MADEIVSGFLIGTCSHEGEVCEGGGASARANTGIIDWSKEGNRMDLDGGGRGEGFV
jgi:hypothetical protein